MDALLKSLQPATPGGRNGEFGCGGSGGGGCALRRARGGGSDGGGLKVAALGAISRLAA